MAEVSTPSERSAGTPFTTRLRTLAVPLARLRSITFFQLLFFVYLFATLGVLAFMVPPFQKSDEPGHYYRAVSLANGDLTCSRDQNGFYYYKMTRRDAEAPLVFHVWDVALQGGQRFDRDWLKADFSDSYYNETAHVLFYCNLPPVGYLPNALGVLMFKSLDSPLTGIYAARVFGGLFFVGCVIWALRVVPERYRLVVYFFAAGPMVLHQVTGITYDTTQLALFPVLFAYLARFIVQGTPPAAAETGAPSVILGEAKDPEDPDESASPDEALQNSLAVDGEGARGEIARAPLIARRDLIIFLAVMLVSINIRPLSYVPLLGFVFAIRPSQIAPTRLRYLAIMAGYLLITFVLTAVLVATYVPRTGLNPNTDGVDAKSQAEALARNPLRFVEVFHETLHVQGDWLFKQTVGVFGWVDTPMNWVPYYVGAILLFLLGYHLIEHDVKRLHPLQLLVILGTVAATVISIFLTLYIVWTPVDEDQVLGLQGRYFVGLVPFFVLGVVQLAIMMGRRRFVQVVALIAVVVFFRNIVRAVDLRYYGDG